ncbi:MAG: phage/plasmid primase, P4 family [Polyangiaceae bacterium]
MIAEVERPLVCLLTRANLFAWPPTLTKTGRPATPASGADVAYLPLADALLCEHPSDLHLTGYSVPDMPHRLQKGAPETLPGGVSMVLLILEVDCPKPLRVAGRASELWWAHEEPKLAALRADHPEVLGTRSRGGYRVLGWLPEPHIVRDAQSAQEWSELYVAAAAWLHAGYGMRADPKCRDWQHLQRTPRALRGEAPEPGEPDTREREPGIFIGDPHQVGEWDVGKLDLALGIAEAQVLAKDHLAWAQAVKIFAPATSHVAQAPGQSATPADVLLHALRPAVAKIRENGGRHTLYMALAGTMLDRGFAPDDLPDFMGRLSILAGVDEARLTADRVKVAQTTAQRARSGDLYSRVGTLHAHYPEVLAALDVVLPPQRSAGEEAVLRALCKDVVRAAAIPDIEEGSDLDAAEIALAMVRARGTEVVHDRDDFWSCDGEAWHPSAGRLLELEVHRLNGAPLAERGSYKVNEPRVKGALKRAATLVSAPGFFDQAPTGVAFQNGYLVVSDGGDALLTPIAPEHRALELLPFPYIPAAQCPLWLRVLDDVFRGDADAAEKIALLQEFAGSSLLGIATRWQRCLVLEGASGDNGKSTVLRALSALFHASMRRSIAPQKFGQEYYLAKLAGCRFNVVAEMPRTDLEHTEAFKAVISGDRITGRHPSGRPFDFHPIAGHAFACNELPGTSDQTEAYWKRFLPIPFNRRFTDAEQDKGLADRILQQEMAGVAAWAVEGARRALRQDGLTVPSSVTARKGEWRKQSDQVALFADDCLEAIHNGDPRPGTHQVYASYQRWAQNSGHRGGMNAGRFEARLRALGWKAEGGEWVCKLRGNASNVQRMTDAFRSIK